MAKTKKLRITCTEGKPQKVGDKLVTVRRGRGKRLTVVMEPMPVVVPAAERRAKLTSE